MVIGTLESSARYEALHPLFAKLFEYVKSHNLLEEPLGRITLDGDDLFINNVNPECLDATDQVLEVHREYIDVHFLLEGSETIGWTPLEDVENIKQPYDAAAECALYAEPAQTYVKLKPGQFCIVWPEDPHAPVIGEGKIRKAIAKVRL